MGKNIIDSRSKTNECTSAAVGYGLHVLILVERVRRVNGLCRGVDRVPTQCANAI